MKAKIDDIVFKPKIAMRIKTIFIIVVTVVITIVLMQNSDEVLFSILFWNVYVSKLIVMAALVLVGLIVGYLLGRPRKNAVNYSPMNEDENKDSKPDTLSEEDRDYIS